MPEESLATKLLFLLWYGNNSRFSPQSLCVYFYSASLIQLPAEFLYLLCLWKDLEFIAHSAKAATKLYLCFHHCDASFLAGSICYNSIKNIPVEVDFKMKTCMKCLT